MPLSPQYSLTPRLRGHLVSIVALTMRGEDTERPVARRRCFEALATQADAAFTAVAPADVLAQLWSESTGISAERSRTIVQTTLSKLERHRIARRGVGSVDAECIGIDPAMQAAAAARMVTALGMASTAGYSARFQALQSASDRLLGSMFPQVGRRDMRHIFL